MSALQTLKLLKSYRNVMMQSSILKAMNKIILCSTKFHLFEAMARGRKKKQPKQSINIDNNIKKYGDLAEQVLVQKLSAISLKLTD